MGAGAAATGPHAEWLPLLSEKDCDWLVRSHDLDEWLPLLSEKACDWLVRSHDLLDEGHSSQAEQPVIGWFGHMTWMRGTAAKQNRQNTYEYVYK